METYLDKIVSSKPRKECTYTKDGILLRNVYSIGYYKCVLCLYFYNNTNSVNTVLFTAGVSIYLKQSSQYPGSYFPRNSFVTDGTPILVERNTRYRVLCYSSGAGEVSLHYRNGTKPPASGYSYSSYYSTQGRFNQLTRIISRNPSNEEFYCKGNQRTAWFGMFVNRS